MEKNNIILNELRDISPVVANISNRQVYTVPEGYFEGLATQLMLYITAAEKAGVDPVLDINKNNVYQVQEGYFDTLAGNILNLIKTEEESKQLEEPNFSSPLWQQIGKKNPFTVPEGYFTEVSDNIVAGAKAIEFVNEELENLSPLMTELKTRQVYEVPDGYFDTTTAAIFEKIKDQQSAKVISFGFSRKIMRYAVAAAIAGIVLVAGYVGTRTPGKLIAGATKHTSTLDSLGGSSLSDLDLENFLNNNTASVADTSMLVPTDEISDKDSKDLLANISDEELQHYAEQHLETPITN